MGTYDNKTREASCRRIDNIPIGCFPLWLSRRGEVEIMSNCGVGGELFREMICL
jgi:hypothetical protein